MEAFNLILGKLSIQQLDDQMRKKLEDYIREVDGHEIPTWEEINGFVNIGIKAYKRLVTLSEAIPNLKPHRPLYEDQLKNLYACQELIHQNKSDFKKKTCPEVVDITDSKEVIEGVEEVTEVAEEDDSNSEYQAIVPDNWNEYYKNRE